MIFSAAILLSCLGAVEVRSQHLAVALDVPNHSAAVESTMELHGAGQLTLQLTRHAAAVQALSDGVEIPFTPAAPGAASAPTAGGHEGVSTYALRIARPASRLTIRYQARFEQDISAGEKPGQIHNFSVDAHLGPQGVFLSDGSAWHPQPVDEDGTPLLRPMSIDIAPVEGFALVASGEPAPSEEPLSAPRWRWATPRPVDGLALAGGPHELRGRAHPTVEGPVEVVVHVPKEHAAQAEVFLDAACKYLDLYVPLLGAMPYQRFSIVENFFSSGFAYPGFTLLGPQVVAMGSRALAPGYLDHELVHNWWGNGVYVDSSSGGDGNWCEALTSYCANYGRRLLEEGDEAAKAYRRGILMRLSTDPAGLDNAPLGDFGRRGAPVNPDRFVGYEKGTFFFIMLEATFRTPGLDESRARWWKTLRRFAEQFIGRRASWDDFKTSVEAEYGQSRTEFFETWLRKHTVPVTGPEAADVVQSLASQIANGQGVTSFSSANEQGRWLEVDPDFMIYRVLPAAQIIPTLAGTTGAGGMRVFADSARPEIATYLETVKSSDAGENLLIIGREAAAEHAELLSRASDSIQMHDGAFVVGGKRYDKPAQAVLHTMQHPDHPGRFISVFLANGDAGWSRLRLIGFYTRDTTIVWDGEKVIDRRVHEPDRRLRVGP